MDGFSTAVRGQKDSNHPKYIADLGRGQTASDEASKEFQVDSDSEVIL